MNTPHTLLLLALAALSTVGCAPGMPEESDSEAGVEDDVEALIQGPDLATTEIVGGESSVSVIAGNLKLTMSPAWETVVRDGQPFIRITGSSSKNLDGVFSFVFDDAFGQANLLTKRKFEVLIPESGSELNTILAGGGLYLQLQTSVGTTHYTAKLVTGPTLHDFSGTTALTVDRLVRPIYVADGVTNLRYRGSARTQALYDALAVTTAANANATVSKKEPKRFDFDWTFASVKATLDAPEVTFTLTKPGVTRTKTAELEAELRSVSLTTLDPYETWGNRECKDDVLACIQALPAGTTDLGSCGVYYDVQICKILNP